MPAEPDEVEGLDPERETVCPVCWLVFWVALGYCPTCEAEGGTRTRRSRLPLRLVPARTIDVVLVTA